MRSAEEKAGGWNREPAAGKGGAGGEGRGPGERACGDWPAVGWRGSWRRTAGRLPLGAVLLLALGMAGCGDGDPTAPADPVRVTVSPGSATVGAAGTQTFSAAVTGSSNTAVTWTTTGGTLTPSGNQATLQAPPTGGSITVTATSQADAGASGSATVTVTPVQVALSRGAGSGPGGALFRGESVEVTAAVTGTTETGLTWEASCGALESQGSSATFAAPADAAGSCQVTATSTLDPEASATLALEVLPDWLVTSVSDTDDACSVAACNLRGALLAAASGEGPVDAQGRAVIRVASALAGDTLVLASALPMVETHLRLLGPEAGALVLDAAAGASARRRVLHVSGQVEVELRNLHITGGESVEGAGLRVDGGAMVRLLGGEISGNRGVPSAPSAGGFLVTGASTLELEDVVVRANRNLGPGTAAGAGGSVVEESILRVRGGAFLDNEAPNGWGGALRVDQSEVEMEGTELRGNRAMADDTGGGGAIWARTARITLQDVLLEDNESAFEAGGLRALTQSEVTLENAVFRGNSARTAGALTVANGSTALVRDSRFEGNEAETRAGAIFAWTDAVLTLEDVELVGNMARDGGGAGLYAQTGSQVTYRGGVVEGNRSHGFARGAGIAMFPGTTLVLEDVRLEGNAAASAEGGGGGALYLWETEATLARLEILDNEAESGPGGGIAMWDGAVAHIQDVRVEGNTSTGAGGALFSRSSGGTLERVILRGNSAVLQTGGFQMIGGSDWEAVELVVEENISDATVGGIGVFQTTRFHLRQSVVAENRAATSAGGIWFSADAAAELLLEDVEVRENTAGAQAGGLALLGAGEALLRRVVVEGNAAEGSIGGILAVNPRTLITESAVVGNDGGAGWGGGLHLGGGAELTNTTVSGNRAPAGGGIHMAGGGGLLNGVTVAMNRSDELAAGLRFHDVDGWTVVNVLLAGNRRVDATEANCSVGSGSPVSLGHNISGDASCSILLAHSQDAHGVETGVDSQLNTGGGATPFHPLLEGSAALGAGRPDRCLAVDQRGWTRASPCDVGAWEAGGTPPAGAAPVAQMWAPARAPANAQDWSLSRVRSAARDVQDNGVPAGPIPGGTGVVAGAAGGELVGQGG